MTRWTGRRKDARGRVRSRRFGRLGWVGALAIVLTTGLLPATAAAQSGPDATKVSFSTGLDVPSTYVFRGYLQEDRGLIAWPFAELGLTLFEGQGGVQEVSLTAGFWNSLHRGATGSDGPSGQMWYERDFYAAVSLDLANNLSVGTTYTSYVSPNRSFDTIHELAVEVAFDDGVLSPYGLVAFELDSEAATYLELGIEPGVTVIPDRLALAFPTSIGLSLRNYYQGPDGDARFGYLSVGALAEVPVVSGGFGALSLQGGVNVLALGETCKLLNHGKGSQVIGVFGINLSY